MKTLCWEGRGGSTYTPTDAGICATVAFFCQNYNKKSHKHGYFISEAHGIGEREKNRFLYSSSLVFSYWVHTQHGGRYVYASFLRLRPQVGEWEGYYHYIVCGAPFNMVENKPTLKIEMLPREHMYILGYLCIRIG